MLHESLRHFPKKPLSKFMSSNEKRNVIASSVLSLTSASYHDFYERMYKHQINAIGFQVAEELLTSFISSVNQHKVKKKLKTNERVIISHENHSRHKSIQTCFFHSSNDM